MLNALGLRLLDAHGVPAYAPWPRPLFGGAQPTDADGRPLYDDDDGDDAETVSSGGAAIDGNDGGVQGGIEADEAAAGLPPHPYLPCTPGVAWTRAGGGGGGSGGGLLNQRGQPWLADPPDAKK
eukprot:363442-Chlamydomonas_euryale.AAC.1